MQPCCKFIKFFKCVVETLTLVWVGVFLFSLFSKDPHDVIFKAKKG